MLKLLFDYVSSEEIKGPTKDFVKSIRLQLTELIIAHLSKYGEHEDIDTIIEYLLPFEDRKIFSVKDLLFAIVSVIQKQGTSNNVFVQYIKKLLSNGGANSGISGIDFSGALLILVETAIYKKAKLLGSLGTQESSDTSLLMEKLLCLEYIISYSIYILLSLPWSTLFESQYSTPFEMMIFTPMHTQTVYPSHGYLLSETPGNPNKTGQYYINLLNPKLRGKSKTTEDIILKYLMQRVKAGKKEDHEINMMVSSEKSEKYEIEYLGEKTYYALLSHCLPSKSLSCLSNFNDIFQAFIPTKEIDQNAEKMRLILSRIIQNVKSFEKSVQQMVFKDCLELCKKPAIFTQITIDDDIFSYLCFYLTKSYYFNHDPILKTSLENLFMKFFVFYWKSKFKREALQNSFIYLIKLPISELLQMLNQIINTIISENTLYYTAAGSDETFYSAIQFIYFLEDITSRTPDIVTEALFIQNFVKFFLFLNELNLIYFWYPTFTLNGLPKDSSFESDKYTQREGGVVRVILKLMNLILIKMQWKSELMGGKDCEFELQIINKAMRYFIFQKRKTLGKLAALLNVAHILPSVKDSAMHSAATHDNLYFLRYAPQLSAAINQIKLKLMNSDKTLISHKSVEDANNKAGKKDIFESSSFKFFYLFTGLLQLFIYSSLSVLSYESIKLSDLTAFKASNNIKSRKSFILAKLLGSLTYTAEVIYSAFPGGLAKLLEDFSAKRFFWELENCCSNFQGYSKETLEKALILTTAETSSIATPRASGVYELQKQSSYTGGDPNNSNGRFTLLSSAQEDMVKTLKQISVDYNKYKFKKCYSKEEYYIRIREAVIQPIFLKEVVPRIHEIAFEDILVIERGVLMYNEFKKEKSDPQKMVHSHAKSQHKDDKSRFRELHSILIDQINLIESGADLKKTEIKEYQSKKIVTRMYDELKKEVLAEEAFIKKEKMEEKVFLRAKNAYGKLLSRCPLYKLYNISKALFNSQPYTQNPIYNRFVKLDLKRDNLNRALRLKPMKDPLKNNSVLKGISYMKLFFLKRMLITSIYGNDEAIDVLVNHKKFLFPSTEETLILKALFSYRNITKSLSSVKSTKLDQNEAGTLKKNEEEEKKLAGEQLPEKKEMLEAYHGLISWMQRDKFLQQHQILLSTGFPKMLDSQSLLSTANTAKSVVMTRSVSGTSNKGYYAELIKVDHSIFGQIMFSETNMTFTAMDKSSISNQNEFRLGPARETAKKVHETYEKIWKFSQISRIMSRRYNLIRQAIEITLTKNNKNYFIVLFSEEKQKEVINMIQKVKKSPKYSNTITIIDDPKKEFKNRKFTEDWKKRKLSTFEYLTLINDYASRTCEDLSQYPVFPWVLSVNNTDAKFDQVALRDFQFPIAAISQKKRDEAKKKYDDTADDCYEERYQFGRHYMPGRAVLGYLMRIQPYTEMIYYFDSGGDCPSRHQHLIFSMWENAYTHSDNNSELIPEFFYNPEFLANHNNYSFGLKQLEEDYEGLQGKMVRVRNNSFGLLKKFRWTQ